MIYYRYIFLLVFILIFFAIHFYFIKRFINRLEISSFVKNILKATVWLNFLFFLGYLVSRYMVDVPNWLYFLFSLSIGVVLLLFISTLFYEIIFFLQGKIGFINEYKSLIDILSIILLFTYLILAINSTQPKIVKVRVNENLFHKKYKIAQISDLHIGSLIGKESVKEIVRKINLQNVDLVVITGDLVDSKPEKSKEALDELKNLKGRFGTYYVLGNHEYFRGAKEILTYVESLGINALKNSSKRVGDFYIAGVYDSRRRGGIMDMNITKTFANIPKDFPVLLLMHRPSGIKKLKGFKPSLILSGHTHGGQIWPFGYVVKLFEPFLKGLHKLSDKSFIYVNSGSGFWGPPMRVGTNSEITIIEWM